MYTMTYYSRSFIFLYRLVLYRHIFWSHSFIFMLSFCSHIFCLKFNWLLTVLYCCSGSDVRRNQTVYPHHGIEVHNRSGLYSHLTTPPRPLTLTAFLSHVSRTVIWPDDKEWKNHRFLKTIVNEVQKRFLCSNNYERTMINSVSIKRVVTNHKSYYQKFP